MDKIWIFTRKNNSTNNYDDYFFLIVTPIGLIMRLSQKDILKLKKDKNSSTYGYIVYRKFLFKENKSR